MLVGQKILQLFWDGLIATFPTVETYTETDSSTQGYFIYWNEAKKQYQANNAKGWEATRPASSDTSKVYEWNSSSKSWDPHNNIVW